MLAKLLNKSSQAGNDQYEWVKQKKYYGKYKDAESWEMEDLFNHESKDDGRSLPYLGPKPHIAMHNFHIDIFPSQPFIRPYRLEEKSREDKGDEIITVSKKIFMHHYDGPVDVMLSLRYCGGMDSEGRGSLVFLDGDLKAGIVTYGGTVSTANEYKKWLNNYFEDDEFSDHLGNFFQNSNLPEEVKIRFSSL